MIFLGIDSGTQSTKCIALDLESGSVPASAQRAYGFIGGLPPGHLEQDPADWKAALFDTIAECLEALGPRRAEVRGIGVSGQQHGLVALDVEGAPVRAAKLWCDTSTAAQCQRFEEAFGGVPGLIALAGNAIPPGFTAPKLLWLKENEPHNFEKIRHIQLPHDYLNFLLTGAIRMEHGDASGTGLLDVRTRQWRRELVDFIDPRLADWLPALSASGDPCGALRPDLLRTWNLCGPVTVSAGGGDNMMGAIGTGNVVPGVVTASFGTSGTLYAYSESPVIDPEGEVAAFCDSTGAWLPLVCTMNVTVATEQARRLFGWDVRAFDDAVSQAAPGADGILFLPYLNGERTPNLPHGTGVFHGLTMHNMRPANLARAAMEGATLGLAYGLNRLRSLGIHPTQIRLTGGGSNSAVWRRIAADVFGVPVVCPAVGEGAALGAAIQAAWSAGVGDVRSLAARLVTLDPASLCEPDPVRTALYSESLARFSSLTRSLHGSGLL